MRTPGARRTDLSLGTTSAPCGAGIERPKPGLSVNAQNGVTAGRDPHVSLTFGRTYKENK